MKPAVAMPGLRQINLYNATLIPTRELFSARLILWWVVIALLAMAAVARFAYVETQSVSREVTLNAGRQAAEKARIASPSIDGEVLPTPQQVAALETALRSQQMLLNTKRIARDTLRHGAAFEKGGSSALMRLFAESVPPQAWLTEIRSSGPRIEFSGKTLDPLAVNALVVQLNASGYLAAGHVPVIRIERMEPAVPPRAMSVYSFGITASLVSPFADEGIWQ